MEEQFTLTDYLDDQRRITPTVEIGRASCRERV